jgi:hypothetical protein
MEATKRNLMGITKPLQIDGEGVVSLKRVSAQVVIVDSKTGVQVGSDNTAIDVSKLSPELQEFYNVTSVANDLKAFAEHEAGYPNAPVVETPSEDDAE